MRCRPNILFGTRWERVSHFLMASALSALFSMILLFAFRSFAAAQTGPTERLQATIAKVEEHLDSGHGPLKLVRIEELEDGLLTSRGNRGEGKPFFVYQAQVRGDFYHDGQRQLWSGGGLMLREYVAISRDGERVYRLGGFPESEADFRRLITDYRIPAPRDSADAQSRALYCARVLFGTNDSEWIRNEDDAKRHIRNRLFGDDRKDSLAEADRWWRKFRRERPDVNVQLTTTISGDRTFTTRIPWLWAPVEGEVSPEIRELEIRTDQDGSCHQVSVPADPAAR